MANELPPGFRFADEPAPDDQTPVLPEGFRFADETPLPPRRPAGLGAEPAPAPAPAPAPEPTFADVPLPPPRPAEFPIGNDYTSTDWPGPNRERAGGTVGDALNSLFGSTDPSRITPEQGDAEKAAKVAAAQAAVPAAEAAAARANTPEAIAAANAARGTGTGFDGALEASQPTGDDLADKSRADLAQTQSDLVGAHAAPPPQLTRGRDAAETAINAAGHALTGLAGLAGKVDRDLWGRPWLSQKVEAADKAIDRAFTPDPGRADELGHAVAGAVGGMAPLLPLAAWSPAVAAGFSAAQGANSAYTRTENAEGGIKRGTLRDRPDTQEEYDAQEKTRADTEARLRAKHPNESDEEIQSRADDEEIAQQGREALINRWLSALGGGVIGAAQMLPFSRLLGRVEAMQPGSVIGTVAQAAKNGAQTSVEQVLVQSLSTVGENGIHKLLADKDQGLLEGVQESAAVAAIVGGSLGLAGGFYGSAAARRELREHIERATPDELDAFIYKAQGGKSTREEIDDFLRQKAEAEAGATAQPAPEV
jgi:hypothetical protein